jgi:formamidopyrimidine-DNA glycosylase
MPELPEVETVRRSLLPHLVGRRVEGVVAHPVRLRAGIVPGDWEALSGRIIRGIERRGKYLIFDLGDGFAVIHLGMSGRLCVAERGTACAPHTHLRLALGGGGELRFVDPRRFGVAVVLAVDQLADFAPLAGLGCEPLAAEATEALVEASARSRVPIRNLLLDQTVLAGVGNIYANEALARAGISPARRACTIARRRIVRLADCVREVLADALEAGGTTLADGGFADASGESGYFARSLRVYDREGLPCTACGSAIRRRVLSGRSIYFCSRCQR